MRTNENNMNIIRKLLREFEGYSNRVYKDSLGYLTVGIGHKLTNKELKKYKKGDYIDDYIVQNMFIEDIKNAISLAKQIYPNYEQHTSNIRIFMVLQAYNMGNNLKSFVTSNPQIINFNYGLAYKGFINSKWAKQVSKNRVKKTCNLLLNKLED